MQGPKPGLGGQAYLIPSPDFRAQVFPVIPKMRQQIGSNRLDRNSGVHHVWDSVKGSKYGGSMNDSPRSIRGSD